eukprot:TRINITY_DN33922_c0_g1_i1.p1 TRINITY_DN33922_c0_g1~~TRINITY_DN33922_c0_g1_i1.p1  ORF type:complete len:1307 (-),score=276.85 TRINITY_DN33922_c0_g1_i1:148-4068(-)
MATCGAGSPNDTIGEGSDTPASATAQAISTPPASSGGPIARSHGRITVCCRIRPLLDNELAQNVAKAPWIVTDTSIALRERQAGRGANIDGRESFGESGGSVFGGGGQQLATSMKTRSELRVLDHLRREEFETAMDRVFGEDTTTSQVYNHSFRHIVEGAANGLNGAILAYGQTSSGKTYSVSGSTAKPSEGDEEGDAPVTLHKGIIHFALEDLFSQLQAKTAGDGDREFQVKLTYVELYMERCNDLLRKISPQSQNLPVKEDAETRMFFVEGLTEKFVNSAEEVISIITHAEKRRRVTHTKYNEVSSRSHTLITLCVECTAPLEASECEGVEPGEEPRVTKVSRLVIVDLAGNERVDAGTEYMAESNSINKSLFFLGKVIEKLAGRERDRRESLEDGGGGEASQALRGEHVPFRDSKLTRLLSVHLGGNSQTGVLVTMTPAEDSVEQSLSTLRFAQKASTIRCVAKPVLLSKEQALIMKQREIITRLHQQVRELKEVQKLCGAHQPEAVSASTRAPSSASARPVSSVSAGVESTEDEVRTNPSPTSGSPNLQEASNVDLEQMQTAGATGAGGASGGTASLASTLQGAGSTARNGQQAFVSKSREVDAVVTALHKSNDTLRRQKATIVEEFRELHKAVTEAGRELSDAVAELAKEGGACDPKAAAELIGPESRLSASGASPPWEPAIRQLRGKLVALIQAAEHRISEARQEGDVASKAAAAVISEAGTNEGNLAARLQESEEDNRALRHALSTVGGSPEDLPLREANAKLKEENTRLREALAEAEAAAKAARVEAARSASKASVTSAQSSAESPRQMLPPKSANAGVDSVASAALAEATSTAQLLREENARLRTSIRFLAAERDKLKAAAAASTVVGNGQGNVQSTVTRATPVVASAGSKSPAVAAGTSPSTAQQSVGSTGTSHSRSPAPLPPILGSPHSRPKSCESGRRTELRPLGTACSDPPPKHESNGECDSFADFEPIVERSVVRCARAGVRTPPTAQVPVDPGAIGACKGGGTKSCSPSRSIAASPSRSARCRDFGRGGGLDSNANGDEFEPIVEKGSARNETRGSAGSGPNGCGGGLAGTFAEGGPRPPPLGARNPMLPAGNPPPPAASRPVTEIAPRLAMDYFRQMGVRTSWKAGDNAFWRGQTCTIIKSMPEDHPLRVVLRTPDGSEVTTDICLLSEVPSSNGGAGGVVGGSGGSSGGLVDGGAIGVATDGGDASRPLRLAPLGDLCIDRPSSMLVDRPPSGHTAVAGDRPPILPGGLRSGGGGVASASNLGGIGGVYRSSSVPARGGGHRSSVLGRR